MSIIKSITQGFINCRLFRIVQVAIAYALDYFFDFKYGTDTRSIVKLNALDIDSSNIAYGSQYQPTHALPLKKLFKKLNLPSDKIIVDLGSGKGIVLMVAAECGYKEVHGVEFSKALCDIAEKNFTAFRQKTGSSTIMEAIHSDVTNYTIKNTEDVFYLFNPFDDVVLEKVMTNIHSSLKKHPRKIWIIYFYAHHKDIIEQDTAFSKVMEYRYLGQEFLVYSNQA
jgi:16S rRNA G966 N2-methylase RsmD